MITVELHRVLEGEQDYRSVATVSVSDDGSYELDDPDGFVPVYLPVLLADPAGGHPIRVSLEEDSATWVRNLDSVLRTGYLVPVIVSDDGRPASSPRYVPSTAAGATAASSQHGDVPVDPIHQLDQASAEDQVSAEDQMDGDASQKERRPSP